MTWLAIDSGNDYEALRLIETALELVQDWERVYNLGQSEKALADFDTL